MARITFERVRHSYRAQPADEADYALKGIDTVWEDGGAYALLGPSGCGKTTLLNIISGLLSPSEGRVLFGERDVTHVPTGARQIAQVFQFPVVYDTMTVYDNLAFPLRNRRVPEARIRERVHQIAAMLDLEASLQRRAAGLTADGKQKISLGRGLVREEVNAILFDEPLTVIDPHLKWKLRSQLKALHQQVGMTMIYVTHDQTEALTFADQVVVMHEGVVVQIGTPVELFEQPNHTFVGYFIGSPGMNVLPCTVENGVARFDGVTVKTGNALPAQLRGAAELGVRPESVRFAAEGIPVRIEKVDDLGRYRIVELEHAGHRFKMVTDEETAIPSERPHVVFDPARTWVYADGWVVR